ncbi:unnamed protein product, partial [Leptidea sinapis]
CTIDRKASIVSSICQDVSPTRPRENISPATSQHSIVEQEVPRVMRAESIRSPGNLCRRASSVKGDVLKAVAFENNNFTNSDAMGNGGVVTKPKSRSGSIIGAISPIIGTATPGIPNRSRPSSKMTKYVECWGADKPFANITDSTLAKNIGISTINCVELRNTLKANS